MCNAQKEVVDVLGVWQWCMCVALLHGSDLKMIMAPGNELMYLLSGLAHELIDLDMTD